MANTKYNLSACKTYLKISQTLIQIIIRYNTHDRYNIYKIIENTPENIR